MDETAPGVTELAATADTDAAPPIAELPASTAELGNRQLDPRYIPFQRVVGWIVTASTAACTLAVVVVYWLAADLPAWAGTLLLLGWVLFTVGTGWLSYAWPPIHYRHTSYRLDDEGIEIRIWRLVARDHERAALPRAAHRRVAGARWSVRTGSGAWCSTPPGPITRASSCQG